MIRHLDCAPMRPPFSFGGHLTPERLVGHCLVVEDADGLTLVDTGLGSDDITERRAGRAFPAFLGMTLDPAATALAQLRAAGLSPADVRRIVVTHLDFDHAGGLSDFPEAEVHVFAAELAAAKHPAYRERSRYRAGQWQHGPRWVEHGEQGDTWLGFTGVQVVDDGLLLVPLHGHTRGHCGVAVRRPGGDWFLHAGDSYFNGGEVQTPPSCPTGLRAFQRVAAVDNPTRMANQDRLRTLHREHGPAAGRPAEEMVTVFSAHDAAEFDALAAAF